MGDTPELAALTVLFEKAASENRLLIERLTKLEEAASLAVSLEHLEAIQVEHLGDLLKLASFIIGYAKHGSRVAEEVSIKFTSQTIGAYPDAASIFAPVKPEPASFKTLNRREARFATFGKPFSPPGPVASDQTSFAAAAARGES